MASGIPYKQAKLAETWDAIVIGSGIGGLTAAVLLGVHASKRVLVLKGTTRLAGSPIRFIALDTNGTWVCITSARCRMSAPRCGAHSTTSQRAG